VQPWRKNATISPSLATTGPKQAVTPSNAVTVTTTRAIPSNPVLSRDHVTVDYEEYTVADADIHEDESIYEEYYEEITILGDDELDREEYENTPGHAISGESPIKLEGMDLVMNSIR
jgi:hypothetical protein